MPKKHLFLPQIVTGANLDEPVSNALWEDKQRKIISSISDGIEIDETAKIRGVSSIPDIYARPLTFLSALRNDKHPLRARMIQEWRGLISLLALHKIKPDLGNVTVTPVTLDKEKFSTALQNLTPPNIKLQKNDIEYQWTDILLIKLKVEEDSIAIGAFSPATLVYTSADYNRALKGKSFPFKDDFGYLKPPTKKEDIESIGEWLEGFKKQFATYANHQSSSAKTENVGDYRYVGDINTLIEDWLSDIRKTLGIGNTVPIQNTKNKVGDEPIELTRSASFLRKYDIYKALLTPLEKDDAAIGIESKSDYSLAMARNNRSSYSEVVVITSSLLAQDNKLWEGITPGELADDTSVLISKIFQGKSGTTINNVNIKTDNAIWIRPELYFLTDSLLKAKNGTILGDKEQFLNADNATYILPFKKEILEFFSPVDIQEILKPTIKDDKDKDGKIVFSFNLPLRNGRTVKIEKVYRLKGEGEDEGRIREIDIPVLEIFPNYLGDFWCQYFMLCSDTDTYHIEPVNYAYPEKQFKIIRQEQKFKTYSSTEKAEIVRISGYDSFPEGISITPVGNNNESYGLILLNKDTDVEARPFNGSMKVGIDFGTSNTNIFKYANGNATRWQFSFTKYLRPVLNADDKKRKDFTSLFFVPITDQILPTPTALRIFKAGVTNNMLLDYFIYFPTEYRYPDNVYTDIKWDDDNTKLNSFLKSMIFLLIVDLIQERVGKIEFRCSYPKSFSDDRIRAYKRGWTETLENFFYISEDGGTNEIASNNFIYVDKKRFDEEDGNYSINTNENGKLIINLKPKFITEGIAAGEYFSSEYIITDGVSHANKEDGSVCIDVGGGTSDYSIWFSSKIRLDASVLLAGKQIAKLLKNNARVRDLLFTEEAATALNDVKNDDILFSSRLNFTLRKEEKLIAAKLSTNANNKDIAWLRRILAIEFGALSFYSAHLILALDEFLGNNLSDRIKQSGIKLHWGGNAAKFINWIDYGRYEKDGIASKFLNGMFLNTIMDKSILERAFRPALLGQVQSPGHKDEASGGIVVMNISDQEQKSDMPNLIDSLLVDSTPDNKEILDGLIIGDNITINGNSYQHYHVINKDTYFIDNISHFNSTELTQLERFVYLINQVGKLTGLFPEGSQINLSLEEKLAIKQRVKNDIAALAKLKPDERNIEPVFIMEVKYLLDILSNKMK